MFLDDVKHDDQDLETWQQYYQKTLARSHHPRTEKAASQVVASTNLAIDCGCGTGADIAFLASMGYQVIGFDSHDKAVDICQKRFEYEPSVMVHELSFEDFSYPMASLIIANSSLFLQSRVSFI